jgi:hypothetical protein
MRNSIVATFGIVLITIVGTGSGARAGVRPRVIDFAAAAIGGSVSTNTPDAPGSTSLDLDSSALTVTNVGADDASGLAVGDTITVSPTNIVYGIPLFGPLSPPLVVSWTDSLGAFQETFDDRMKNAGDSLVQIVSIGTITGPGASGGAEIQLIADSGPFTSAIGVLLLDNSGEQGVASTPPAIPEPSTWVLMLAGFAGLGYFGYKASRGTGSAAA